MINVFHLAPEPAFAPSTASFAAALNNQSKPAAALPAFLLL
jgi:hypothetical protein